MYCALRLWTSPFSLEFYTVKRMLIFLHADETWHSTGNKVTLDLKKHNLFKPKKYRLRRNSATEAIHLAGKQILKIFINEPFSKLTNWPVKVTTYGKIILEHLHIKVAVWKKVEKFLLFLYLKIYGACRKRMRPMRTKKLVWVQWRLYHQLITKTLHWIRLPLKSVTQKDNLYFFFEFC